MAQASAIAGPSSSSADGDGILILENPPPISERQKRRRKNLPKEGYSILQDYFFNVNRYPKKHERIELAARVNSLPGGSEPDAYTPLNVEFYFTNMRRRHPQASTVVVKRELVEEPLSFGAGETVTNGTTVEDNHSSISTAPRKKRKSKATAVTESQATPSAHSGQPTMNGATIPESASSVSAAPRKKRKLKAAAVAESQAMTLASANSQHLLPSASTDGSISNLFLPTYNPSSASAPSTTTPNQKKRTRLKAEGYKILTDFFKNVSRYPTAAQKAELLAAVTAIEGCEGYTVKKMTAYFSRMRIERREPVAFVKAESPDSHLNAASSFLHDSSSGSSLVHPSFPEPEPEPEPARARPLVPVPDPLPVLQLAPSVVRPLPILQLAPSMPQAQPKPVLQPQPQPQPQPPALAQPEAQPPPFSAFSATFEPIMYTPKAPPRPQPEPEPEPERTPAPSDRPTAAGDGAAEPDPPRNPVDPTVDQPARSLDSVSDSEAIQADVPVRATPELGQVQPPEKGDHGAVQDSKDAIPARARTGRPKSGSKSKSKSKSESESKAATKQESPKSPKKRGLLSDAARKLLDDYYTNVSSSPSTVQSAALAAQINALPLEDSGGGRCTAKQVRKYFKRRRVEDRCEALKAERMGAGAEERQPALVLVAVVEPKSGSREDDSEAVQETTTRVDPIANDLAGALPSEIAKGEGGYSEVVGSRVDESTSDLSLHGVSNTSAPVANSVAEVEVSELAVPPGGDEVGNDSEGEVVQPSASGESLPDTSNVDAGTQDLEEPTASSSPPAEGSGDKYDSDQMVPAVATDDVFERCEPGDVVSGSPGPDQDGERSDIPPQIPAGEEQTATGIEADVEGTELDSPLLAEVDPNSNPKPEPDESLFGPDLEEGSAASSLRALGVMDTDNSDEAALDVRMDDVPDNHEPERVLVDSPQPDPDDECSDTYGQVRVEEERTDTGIEADDERGERESKGVPDFQPGSASESDHSEAVCEAPADALADSTETLVSTEPMQDADEDDNDQALSEVSMDDVHESPGIHAHIHRGEDGRDAQLELDIEHAQRNSEVVPEVEPEPDSMPDDSESVCEVVTDALPDLGEATASTLLVLEAEDENSNDQAFPEVCMDDVHESPKAEVADLGSSSVSGLKHDSPMDVDPVPAPSAVMQVDVLGLAAQLQRVFSQPPALDEGHPTTFADFATWLEARNVNLVCASS